MAEAEQLEDQTSGSLLSYAVALVESFARGELAADWTNILSNPRADFMFYSWKIGADWTNKKRVGQR